MACLISKEVTLVIADYLKKSEIAGKLNWDRDDREILNGLGLVIMPLKYSRKAFWIKLGSHKADYYCQ